jgi:hypothetical protein
MGYLCTKLQKQEAREKADSERAAKRAELARKSAANLAVRPPASALNTVPVSPSKGAPFLTSVMFVVSEANQCSVPADQHSMITVQLCCQATMHSMSEGGRTCAAAGGAAAKACMERAATSPAAVQSASASAEAHHPPRMASPAKAATSPTKVAAAMARQGQSTAVSSNSHQQPQALDPGAGYSDFGNPVPLPAAGQPGSTVAALAATVAGSPPAMPQQLKVRRPDGGHLTPEVQLMSGRARNVSQ